jgi:hypothetical protein
MAGYSGTPLPKKLGIKEQFHVAFLDLPSDVRAELKDSLKSCRERRQKQRAARLRDDLREERG